jgi:hypothetical protein
MKKTLTGIIWFLMFFLWFFVLGYFLGKIIDTFDYNFGGLEIILVWIIIFICWQVSLILHEAGHLLFGKLTGYSFLSFRYKSFTIFKDERGKYSFKKYGIHGTAGQCLMIPPKTNDLPIFWYNAGGVIVNFFLAVIGLVFLRFEISPLLKIIPLTLFFVNILFVMFNWLPLPNVRNDGVNYKEAKKYQDSRLAFLYLLRSNGEMAYGTRLIEIEFDNDLIERLDVKKPLQASLLLLVSLQQLYNKDFSSYKKNLEKIRSAQDNPKALQKILTKPYYYLVDLIELREEAINKKDKYTKMILKKMKYEAFFQFVNFYEKLIFDGKIDRLLQQKYIRIATNCPTPGEGKDILDLADFLIDAYINNKEVFN